MPDFRYNEINDNRYEVLIDGDVSALLIKASDGKWYLSGVGVDEIELESKLSDGSVFRGGTFGEAFSAIIVDYSFA